MPRPIVMPNYFRWISRGPDLQAARTRILQASVSPRSACWIFEMGNPLAGAYLPNIRGRVLVVFTFSPKGEDVLKDKSNWIWYDTTDFRGEAQHPDKIIVKPNEPGAYGIGCQVLPILNNGHIVNARLANRREMTAVRGRSVPQPQITAEMANQRW